MSSPSQPPPPPDCQLKAWPWTLVPHLLTPREAFLVQMMLEQVYQFGTAVVPDSQLDLVNKLLLIERRASPTKH